MIVVLHVEIGPPARFVDNRTYFGLYNLTQNKWVYERVLVSFPEDGGAHSVVPVIQGDRVYLTTLATVGCYDLLTGKRIWQKRVTDMNTGIIDLMYVDGKLLANTGNATLYCMDATDGKALWEQKSSAFTSILYHQDGVVYLIPSKNLCAVDLHTGKMLWDMPSMDGQSDSFWWGFVTGVPGKNGEKGKIYATSGSYMYAFDAAK